MSQIGWVDFSSDDRNKVKSVLGLLSEEGVLDELGIGQIRDAYSDLIFPGISTIQTRAKYLIIIPRILRDYRQLTNSKKANYGSVQKYLKEVENNIARQLVNVHDKNEPGIIGRTMIESGGVDRRPSEIYWNGLRTFGIVNTKTSLADFCRRMEVDDEDQTFDWSENADGEDDKENFKQREVVHLPDIQKGWLKDDTLRIDLSRLEANFLVEQLIGTPAIANSIPSQLIKHDLLGKILQAPETNSVIEFDYLAETLINDPNVDAQCKLNLKMAKEFSLAMEGPHIRYNILLAKNNNFDEQVEKYEQEYSEWKVKILEQKLFQNSGAERWLTQAQSNGAHRVSSKTESFIKKLGIHFQNDGAIEELDNLIKSQALGNKKERSLLHKKFKDQKWMGIRRLTYRWGTAKNILQDIQKGLYA